MSRVLASRAADTAGDLPGWSRGLPLGGLRRKSGLLTGSGKPARCASGPLRARVWQACIRWCAPVLRALALNSPARDAAPSRKQLRIIALTDLGATAAFNPALEPMDFGRPLVERERLLACVVQLVEAGWTLPVETLSLSPEALCRALDELDWGQAAEVADRAGLQLALPAELQRVRRPAIQPLALIECRYVCSCGSKWKLRQRQVEEDRCPICFTPCFPVKSVRGA